MQGPLTPVSNRLPSPSVSTLQTSHRVICLAFGWVLAGVVLSCLPYLSLITKPWVASVAGQCHSRPDLCVDVRSEVRYFRGWWRGRVFFFTAQPGQREALKSLVQDSCPSAFLDQILSPCYYVGISVTEADSIDAVGE